MLLDPDVDIKTGDKVRAIDLYSGYHRTLEWPKKFTKMFETEPKFFDNEYTIIRIEEGTKTPFFIKHNEEELNFGLIEIRKPIDINNLPLMNARVRLWLHSDHEKQRTGKVFDIQHDHIMFWSEVGGGIFRVELSDIRAACVL